MRTIKLRTLRTHGFRGQDLDIRFGDKDTIISGDNGIGKTTCFDAFLWLINGTDGEDRLNFNIFNQFEETSSENPLRCSVEVELDIDGTLVKLRKEAEQVYKRNRVTGEIERANDTYTYYIDGLETPATKYAQWIENNFGRGGWLKLMLNPRFYEMLDTRSLRNYFADIVGKITAEDFADISQYELVLDLIMRVGMEQARKTFMSEIADLSKVEIQQKAAINAATDALPDIEIVIEAELLASDLESEKLDLERRRASLIGQNDALVAKRKEEEDAIFAKNEELLQAKLRYEKGVAEADNVLIAKLNEAKENNASCNRRRRALEQEIEDSKMRYQTNAMLLERLRRANKEIKTRVFDGLCPTCGASFVGADRAKRLEDFRIRKETDMNNNIDEGKAMAAKVEQQAKELEELQAKLEAIERVDVKPLEDELLEFRRNKRAWITTDECKLLTAELETLESSRTEIPTNEEVVEIQKRVGEIDARLKETYQTTGLRKVYEDSKARIESMKERRKATLQAIATATRNKTLVEQYQREYADIVRERVNRNFKNVRVEMTTVNKSGDIVDTCKLRLDGVTDTCNNANKIKIGIEVAQVFQKHFGVCLPLFVDNAESITEIPEHEGQRVMLVVRSGRPLTIEYDENWKEYLAQREAEEQAISEQRKLEKARQQIAVEYMLNDFSKKL